MKRALVIIACAVAGCGSIARADSGVLRWTNGESILGDFVEATGTTATWKTPLFEDPMMLAWHAIHRVDWPVDAVPAEDSFILSMRDGSAIHGDIVSITGSSIFIHSSRCGDAELKRSEVLSARRIRGDALLLAGPTGDAGWQPWEEKGGDADTVTVNRLQFQGGMTVMTQTEESGTPKLSADVPPLTGGPGGALQMSYWNRGALLFVSLPDAVDVEFHVHSSERPSFLISLGAKPENSMRIETWDDEVVAAVGTDFKLIQKLGDADRDVALRFCWDRNTRHCAVFTPAGEPIMDWQAPAGGDPPSLGVRLDNKGRDLSLDFLRIRSWTGSTPPKVDLSKPRVELEDGRILPGEVASAISGTMQLREEGDQQGASFALKDVDALVFSPDALASGSAEATLSYADGTYLQGQLTGIGNGSATIQTSFVAQPLVSRMDALRQLLVNAPAAPDAAPDQPLAKLDTLHIQENAFHGTFATAGDSSPRWLPAGSMTPVALPKALPYEIDRWFPEDAPLPSAPALFYTRAGDVLPGTLVSLDRAGAEIDSGVTKTTRLPATELEAIQFDASGRLSLHGFNDPGWRTVTGDASKVIRSGDSVELEEGGSIGHPAAMQGSEIRFDVNANTFAVMRLRMFCPGTDRSKSTKNLLIATGINGGIVCGTEAAEGQLDEPQYQARASGTVAVRLVILTDEVDVYFNGACARKFPISSASRAGAGLVIEPASIWGNAVNTVSISDFSTSSLPGCAWLPDVAPDAKTQALTIPRFRRDDPPAHALIAANGDILRGEVEAATKTDFGFRAGLEELTVPRDRVKAVIWLGKPQENAPPPPAKNPTTEKLNDQIHGWVIFSNSLLENFIGYIKNQEPGLEFQVPKNTQKASLRLGNETVAAALDKVCAAYGMSYRVDDKGIVVLESGVKEPDAMVEKMYWLKAGSFPASPAADKVLAAKGISFPDGAAAEWNADTGQLRVKNTPENQALVAQALAASFGGADAPTHWLQLTSGARITLAVEKFDKDVIVGRHPVYGECTVPTADVAIIRTSPLDPSPAMRSVADWRLVYAPEPVLPGEGGDTSASIGKPAAQFKLPLLAGGQFDLSQQSGKVVVLDFWATWCGPCVHSLPELIDAMSAFPPDRVKFIGVDQDEPAAQVKQFLETRGWNLNVALDAGSTVGQQYGVDAIPHTVIIGPDGKVAWVNTGYTPDAETQAAKEVSQLLAAPH